jgi:type I restriction enzyme S subunit
MNLETFFEKFNQFADAPDAVAKMRELVLQLAVQGRLVSQSSEDETAHVLAGTISEDRAAYVKSRSLARLRVLDPVTEDQYPFALPLGWVWTRLGNLCRVQPGFAFESASFVQGDYGVPIIRIRDITKDHTQVNFLGEYRDEFLVEAGDYLVGMDGNFTVAKWRGPRALLNQRVSRLQWYSQHLEPAFFAIAAQHRLTELQGTKAYTTVDHLSSGQIEKAVVPLPPLAEQKRIVAKVDELMALCDQLESQQKERNTRQAALVSASLSRFADAPTPENLNYIFHKSYDITPAELRKTILTLAVQGKLVPQDPSDEPAEELVARVATEKLRLFQAKEIKSETHLDPISDEEVFPIPASWIWRRAGDLCRPISSGSTPDQRVFHPSEGIPYLKVYNIRNQTVDFDYKRQFIAVNHHKERMKRSILRPGDVIMNIVGPPLGKVAVVPHTYPEWNCNQAISFFRPIFPELAPYLYTYLKEGSFLQNIQLIGTAGQDNISVTKCKFIPVPLPPLAEQRRIVAKVEELMKLVDELEAQIAMSRDSAVKLLDAIVHEFTSR